MLKRNLLKAQLQSAQDMIGGKDAESSLKLFFFKYLIRKNSLVSIFCSYHYRLKLRIDLSSLMQFYFTFSLIWKNFPFLILEIFIDRMSAHGLGRVLRRSQTAQIRTTSQYHSRPTPHHLPIKIGLKLYSQTPFCLN